jgi:UDP-N-acetylmuramoylalanine--D-glutamate ligase
VMGLGNFGGGAAVTRWLCEQGSRVLLTDRSKAEDLSDSLAGLSDLLNAGRVELALGGHREVDFTKTDCVVANPAVPLPWNNPFLKAATEARVPVTTEIRLVIERLADPSRVIGITGSAGKSTTSAMIAHLLERTAGKVHFGGNIGGSLLSSLSSMRHGEWTVLELSSAMLHWLGEGVGFAGARGWSPRIAVLTNLRDNHGDWHGSFKHYADSKFNLFRWRSEEDVAIAADDGDEAFSRFAALSIVPRTVTVTPDVIEAATMAEHLRLRIPGSHNRLNARTAVRAVGAALAIDGRATPDSELFSNLSNFGGLPHRLQLVAEGGGVRYFNDSKSTTPESCLLAIRAFDEDGGPGRIHLIAGGYDKKSDLTPVASLASSLAGLYTVGATGPAIDAACQGRSTPCGTLESAMKAIAARVKPGDIVLLSPACASWGQFRNYEERGDRFTILAREVAEHRS